MEPEEEGPGQFRILEALSATGLRSIRYAKEIKCPGESRLEITANDLSKRAYESIKRNVELNGVDIRYFPVPNIRPCQNCRPYGVFGDKKIRDLVIISDPMGENLKF